MTDKAGWDMTDEELGRVLLGVSYPPEKIGAAIRALFPRPAPPPPTGDVPSVDALQRMFAKESCPINQTEKLVVAVHAKIAHALLEKHARPRMEIDGMTPRTLFDAFCDACSEQHKRDPSRPLWSNESAEFCAAVAHRLATTPAPVVDPDAEVKDLAWAHYCISNPNERRRSHLNASMLWDHMPRPEQEAWRAVAAKVRT